MVTFNIFVLNQCEYAEFNKERNTHFFFKFNPKNQNYIFEMRVAIKTYANILNSIIMYTLCSLDQKYHFGKNWFQKIFCLR